MNYENLIYDAYEYAKENCIPNNIINTFVDIVTKANIELLNYFSELNIPYMIINKLDEFEYIQFLYFGYVGNNELLDRYGITYEKNNIEIMIRKDKQKEHTYNEKKINIIKFPIKLLIDTDSLNKDKWEKLLK